MQINKLQFILKVILSASAFEAANGFGITINSRIPFQAIRMASQDNPRHKWSSFRLIESLQMHQNSCNNEMDFNNVVEISPSSSKSNTDSVLNLGSSVAIIAALFTALPAEAADVAASPVMSAFVAYGHYLSFLLITICLMVERLTVKPGMSVDDEKLVANADIAYGLSGLFLVYTGYLRIAQYGKGFDFYSHEPLFWFKMIMVAVMGACSFFNTTMVIKRSVAIYNNSPLEPMSEKLAKRMNTLANAQLTAVLSIPLAATLMSRGVGYLGNDFPWQVEAAFVPIVLVGLGYKYVKEALDWKETDTATSPLELE